MIFLLTQGSVLPVPGMWVTLINWISDNYSSSKWLWCLPLRGKIILCLLYCFMVPLAWAKLSQLVISSYSCWPRTWTKKSTGSLFARGQMGKLSLQWWMLSFPECPRDKLDEPLNAFSQRVKQFRLTVAFFSFSSPPNWEIGWLEKTSNHNFLVSCLYFASW